MSERALSFNPVDYLVIGHITKDISEDGPILGGTAAYAALTAKAMGLSVGIVTACSHDSVMTDLESIQKSILFGSHTTTFRNIDTPEGRIQFVYQNAPNLDKFCIPKIWQKTQIVHLGPVAQEVDATLVRAFPNSFIGLTIQGWLRNWDEQGRIYPGEWPEARFVMEKADAAVMSIEDIEHNEIRIEEMVSYIRILVVTEGGSGARVYWNGDLRYFRPPNISSVVDTTGAGDIFATTFFIRLNATRNPWEAARFATEISALSTQRRGLDGVPTINEINSTLLEIIRDY